MQELIRAVIVPDWVRFVNFQWVQGDDPSAKSMPIGEPEREIPSIFTEAGAEEERELRIRIVCQYYPSEPTYSTRFADAFSQGQLPRTGGS